MKISIKIFLAQLIFLVCLTSVSFAQNKDINGNYSSSNKNITIIDNRMIVTISVYEFYGQPSTVYRYTYKIIWQDLSHILLKLKKSKIISGPKRMAGSGRIFPKSHNPNYEGTFEVKFIDEGIELISNESSKKVTFKKKNT